MNTLTGDELTEIVSYLNPTEIRNLVDSEMLYTKIPIYALEKVATKYNLPLTDSVIELDEYYYMTMYRRLQYGDLEYVMKNLMTIMEATILLETTKDKDIFMYVLERVKPKLNGKMIYNAYSLGVDIGSNKITDLLIKEDYRGILKEACISVYGDHWFLAELAERHLSPDEYISILSQSGVMGKALLEEFMKDQDGIGKLDMIDYLLRGNYNPTVVKKYLLPNYNYVGTAADTALILSMLGDFELASDILGKEIRTVDDLFGSKLNNIAKVNADWIAKRAIQCDNLEVYRKYKKGLEKYSFHLPLSEAMVLELIGDEVDIDYSKCQFDHRTILEKYSGQAEKIANYYASKNDKRVLNIIDKYLVNIDKILDSAVRDPNFTPHLSLKLIERGAMLNQAWVTTLEAYLFCINVLHLNPNYINYVDRTAEGDSELARLGYILWSNKGKVRI